LIVVNLTKGKIMAACMAAKGPHLKEIAYLTLRLMPLTVKLHKQLMLIQNFLI
jgi:hypothetical protein